MAAGAYNVYSNAILGVSKGSFNLSTDNFFMILANTNYTPAVSTDSTYANVSASELATGSGYTAGGVKLMTVTDTLATDTVTFTCANVVWSSFSGVFRYAVIVRSANGTGLASTDLLLCYSDLSGSGNITGGGGTLTLQANTTGVFTITHSP